MASKLQTVDLDAVLAQMPTPLVVLEVGSGAVIYANAAATGLPFAYTTMPGVTVVDPAGQPVRVEAMPHTEARRGQPFDDRLVHFCTDARNYSLLFHSHSLGNGLQVLTFEDVTSLDDIQRQLREALQARDELVSMAAHELRSPLGALQLVAERLCRKSVELGHDDLKKMADTAIRQTRRLTVLVSNLLDVSRIRSGNFELDLEPGALGEIISDACEPLAEQAQTAGTSLHLLIADPAQGVWDRVRMEQVIVNLVTNAIKYGGGTAITVHLARIGGAIELRVADGGMGIAPEEMARIFEPFARATRSHAAQSLGLGLFIVREIVRAHRGTIEVASSPGHTEFTINLPLQR